MTTLASSICDWSHLLTTLESSFTIITWIQAIGVKYFGTINIS